jgi:hypothetical protein
MLYNLACAEARAGETDAAVAAVRSSLAAGFEDIDRLATDPDLAALRRNPDFLALLTEEGSRLVLLARERGADLVEGRRAGPIPLQVRGDGDTAAPALYLNWTPLGLEFTLTADGIWTGLARADAVAPWRSGPAVLVTLAVPGSKPSFETDNTWVLAFGMEAKQPIGALYVSDRAGWQRIVELNPRLTTDDSGVLTFRATVPWRTIRPFHPLVDTTLGLNIALRVPRADGTGFQVAELVPDPARFAPATARRRFAVLTFDPGTTAGEAFVGRLDDSVVRDGSLDVELTAVVRSAGRGAVSVDFLDAAGRSVLPDGALAGGIDLADGLNEITRTVDFSSLDMGTYQLRAELVFPAGARATWSTTILHLPPGWDEGLAARIAALPARDRPTADHLLGLVRSALDRHLPRRHPGAIATTLGQLTALLDRAEATGTLLPATGPFTLAYPGPGGTRLVEGFLTPAGAADGPYLPVLVLTDAAHAGDRLLQRMILFDGRQPPEDGSPAPALAYLVPRLPAGTAESADAAAAAFAWAGDYFDADRVLLVGIDGQADEMLALAARHGEHVAAAAVFAGGRVGPPAGLEGLRSDLPLTWFAFPLEAAAAGSDAARLRDLLADRGLEAIADREIPGGMSLSQIGDRTVLWAREAARD